MGELQRPIFIISKVHSNKRVSFERIFILHMAFKSCFPYSLSSNRVRPVKKQCKSKAFACLLLQLLACCQQGTDMQSSTCPNFLYGNCMRQSAYVVYGNYLLTSVTEIIIMSFISIIFQFLSLVGLMPTVRTVRFGDLQRMYKNQKNLASW